MIDRISLFNVGCVEVDTGRWKPTGRALSRIHLPLRGKATYHDTNGNKLLEVGNAYLLVNSFTKDLEFMPEYGYYHFFMDFRTTPPFMGRELLRIPLEEDEVVTNLLNAARAMTESYTRRSGDDKVPKSETVLWEKLQRLLEVLALHLQDAYGVGVVENDKLEGAIDYIQAHYAEKINNYDIAAAIHVDERYLGRLFVKYVDISPYQYLTQCRIDHAIGELRRGKTVAETAFACGFQSENAFRIAFKKMMGSSPTEFLKNFSV